LSPAFVLSCPQATELPKPGAGALQVVGIRFFDPNGYFVDVNQVVE
jgi:hypothetical protein